MSIFTNIIGVIKMLYPKSRESKLSKELFKNPTSEYRGTPFWSWNCELDKAELLRQIDCLKEMGFGGFHIHSRPGMTTEYLGDEFMELVKACSDKADKEGMLTWLYDEDYCPSGTAGGMVTKNNAYRLKTITFTVTPCESGTAEEFLQSGKPYLIACFDLQLNNDGTIKEYKKIDQTAEATGTKWYVYMKMPDRQVCDYVDTMNKEAIREFINITYEGYKKAVGDKFGKSVPAIFTDEPKVPIKEVKELSHDLKDVSLPWTQDFADTYRDAYGDDITDYLPELVWELSNRAPSLARYRYHDHISKRFTEAFVEQCGNWCKENSLALTGHVMGEDTLFSQTKYVVEAMRCYKSFEIPGIDMLRNAVHLSTAKQTQSAVHQYNKEGMLSELYGVTDWTFDFRGYKFQGDWQAALGVTVRVPHLSWVSMKGVAKRDYPASISYQSPWYKEYSYIEDHYARLNTVLTRGKPDVKVGVIHPVESMWLCHGPRDLVWSDIQDMENNFKNIIETLLFGLIDFDFICESEMPSQYNETSDSTLKIGSMQYDAIIVPNLRTIRHTTLEILTEFQSRGGKLIFVGNCPSCIDGMVSIGAENLFEKSYRTLTASNELLDMLSSERFLTIFNGNGTPTNNLIYNLRDDNENKYLFIANAKQSITGINPIVNPIKIIINGEYQPQIMDTLTGEIKNIDYEVKNGKTIISYTLHMSDSLLLQLGKYTEANNIKAVKDSRILTKTVDYRSSVEYERDEPNVAVLDMAEYSYNGTDYESCEEVLRIDKKTRKDLYNAGPYYGKIWKLPKDKTIDYVYLRFKILSEFEAECALAYEEAEQVTLNGTNIPITDDGYYVDTGIRKMALPKLKCGENIIIIKAPISRRIRVENYYLIGDFDVKLTGCNCIIQKPSKHISFGSIVHQGMPFYGGNIVYKTKINTPECDIKLRVSEYKGALLRIYVDGEDKGPLVFDPYIKEISNLSCGEHTIEIKFFGNRKNTFGMLHNCDETQKYRYFDPTAWYTTGERWSYDYCLTEIGIMKSPVIEIYEKQ